MAHNLSCRVLDNQPVGPGVHLLRLEAPAIARAARPGQFVMLRVSPGPEPLLARPFSVHGVEGNELLILYQVKGQGTALLAESRPKDELKMWGPLGSRFILEAKRPALVAGGMGIAPMTFAAEQFSEKVDEIRLLYGLPASEGLEELWLQFDKRLDPLKVTLSFSTEDGSLGEHGLITEVLEEMLSLSPPDLPDAILACGPLPMLKAVAAMANEHKVPCQVSLEAPMACGVGACLGCALPAADGGYLRVCQEGPVCEARAVDWERTP